MKCLLKQLTLSSARPTANRSNIKQRGEHRRGGEKKTEEPVENEGDSAKVSF
jgi:hypothetical protein